MAMRKGWDALGEHELDAAPVAAHVGARTPLAPVGGDDAREPERELDAEPAPVVADGGALVDPDAGPFPRGYGLRAFEEALGFHRRAIEHDPQRSVARGCLPCVRGGPRIAFAAPREARAGGVARRDGVHRCGRVAREVLGAELDAEGLQPSFAVAVGALDVHALAGEREQAESGWIFCRYSVVRPGASSEAQQYARIGDPLAVVGDGHAVCVHRVACGCEVDADLRGVGAARILDELARLRPRACIEHPRHLAQSLRRDVGAYGPWRCGLVVHRCLSFAC